MFNLLYIFLYSYSVTLYFRKPFYKTLGSRKTDFVFLPLLSKNRSFGSKKIEVMLLKKKFFFFKFINGPFTAIRKLIFDRMSDTSGTQRHLIDGCLFDMAGMRPTKNLYYKINRSRLAVSWAFPQFSTTNSVSVFCKNYHGMLFLDNRVGSGLKWLNVSQPSLFFIKLGFYYFYRPFKLGSRGPVRRNLLKLTSDKLFYKKQFSFFRDIILTKKTKSIFSSPGGRNTQFIRSYGAWVSLSSVMNHRSTKLPNTTDVCVLSDSELTGYVIYRDKERACSLKRDTVMSSLLNIYNIRTYNWLITI